MSQCALPPCCQVFLSFVLFPIVLLYCLYLEIPSPLVGTVFWKRCWVQGRDVNKYKSLHCGYRTCLLWINVLWLVIPMHRWKMLQLKSDWLSADHKSQSFLPLESLAAMFDFGRKIGFGALGWSPLSGIHGCWKWLLGWAVGLCQAFGGHGSFWHRTWR